MAQNGTTLTASKTATGFCRKTYDWSIQKSVDKSVWDLFDGDQARVCYSIEVTKNEQPTLEYGVRGTITVTNGGAVTTENLKLVDTVEYKIGAGQFIPLASTVIVPSAQLGPGETGNYNYEIVFTPVSGATAYRNSVQVTITNHSGHLKDEFGPNPKADFSLPSLADCELVNDCVHLSDDMLGIDQELCSSQTVKQWHTFKCNEHNGQQVNTATIVGDTVIKSASATVMINCYRLTVAKDAQTYFTREFTWSVQKSADQTELCLLPSQVFPVNYTVVVSAEREDKNLSVEGNINIHNPAPLAAIIIAVNDTVTCDPLVDPVTARLRDKNCEVLSFRPVTIRANSSITCNYIANVTSKLYCLNTVEVVQQNYLYAVNQAPTPIGQTSYFATAPVDFGSAEIFPFNRCVSYDDDGDEAESLELCDNLDAPLPPFVFKYVKYLPASDCPEDHYDYINTATVKSIALNANGQVLAQDSHTVTVVTKCGGGCTLTQGYWKTHSSYGPARWPDDTWLLLPNGPNTLFFLSGQTWYAVFQVAPAGNSYYVLAHQYMAAKLNQLAGASSTAAVTNCITFAETFFAKYTPFAANALSPKNADRKKALECATLLDQYNNGLIGPGHCSE